MGKEWQWSRGSRKEEKEVVPGCMSGMMHFFDFHQLLFSTSTCTRPPQEAAAAVAGSSPQNQHNYSADELKGVEAPRNSLELDEVAAAKASAGDYYFGIPLAPAPSPAKKKKKKQELHLLVEEEKRSSQAMTPRTPNVVAQLMGLEILPDDEFFTPTAGSLSASLQHSPKITTKSKRKVNKKTNSDHESRGESTPTPPPARQPLQRRDCNVPSHAAAAAGSSRSLPETPRASSERYRDADPRLSLQLNKENSNRSVKEYIYPNEAPGERSLPPRPSLQTTNPRRRDCSKVHDENKSPRSRYDAREIVKQVKESISRRGSTANGSNNDEHLLKSRRTRTSTAEKNAIGNNESKNSAAKLSPSLSPPPPPPPPPLLWRPSCSPEFDIPRPQLIPKPSTSTSSFSYAATRDYPEAKGNKTGSTKCQRASYERFTERITRHTPPPAEVLASPALSTSSPSNMAAAARRRKLEASQDHRQSPPDPPVHQEKLLNGSVKSAALSNQVCSFQQWPRKLSKEQDPEFHYVRSILERAGIMDPSQQQARWFSPSLPIDPFVFHQLELDLPIFPPGPVRHRCNRKLLFHLVHEILGELVGWSATCSFSVDHQQHRRLRELDKELLLERLWSQIRGFPSANCQVIGDIDVLVAGDLTETRVKRLLQHPSVVAEAEDIVLEIEQDVLDSILGEAAASFTYWELTPTE